MRAYIEHVIGIDKKTKNRCLIEVIVTGKEMAYGRELCIVQPVSGEGHVRVNCDSVIVKKN